MSPGSPSDPLVAALRVALGDVAVIVPGSSTDDLSRYLVDWRGRYRGRARAIIRPGTADEVAAAVRLCAEHGISIVPQGGNTGLVGGGIPDDSGQQVLLHLGRLDRVLCMDADNLSMTVEAGCTLAQVQAAASEAGLLFPLSLASEGTCTIGGNLATNAGGIQVLRYGTARELCLGLQVVTAQGKIVDTLRSLRKDNTGYALRDLYIGSEGTLGIITAAALRLHPRPRGLCTALVACATLESAVTLLAAMRATLDAGLTAFEVMGALPLTLVRRHLPEAARIAHALSQYDDAWLVLIEATSASSEADATQGLERALALALDEGLVTQAVIAQSSAQRQAMWALREAIPLAEKTEGLMVKHDIGMPTSVVPDFVTTTRQAIAARWPDARVVCFGHLGDGNLHYNVQPPPESAGGAALLAFESEVNTLVFDAVQARRGTLSAEHGIGALRQAELARRTPAAALEVMHAIKQALDPEGTLNPGRVLSRQAPSG